MSKKQCENPAVYRFTWPGKDEDYICAIHAMKMEWVANSLGLYVQLVRLELDEMGQHQCCQMVTEEERETEEE